MKAVKFHPDAESEMLTAEAYYEEQQPDLGRWFLVTDSAATPLLSSPSLSHSDPFASSASPDPPYSGFSPHF